MIKGRTWPAWLVATAATVAGAGALSLVPLVVALLQRPSLVFRSVVDLTWSLVQGAPLAIALAVVIGGAFIARASPRAGIGALGALAVLATVVYLLVAEVAPRVEYRLAERHPAEAALALHPFGPDTPANLARQAAYVRANPPDRYSFSTDEPLRVPPNWLDYLRHVRGVLAGLTVLNGLLAWAVGRRLRSLSSRRYRWALWTLGLVSAAVFILAEGQAGAAVRHDLSASGALFAWMPLIPWVAALLALAIASRRHRPMSAGIPPAT
ncbi:MAG TPA: hypothetical protein VLH75_03830 [Longimicrobiales bacterium]|nr:hypothetical protein [Longimicrobiales bacterium]